MATQAPGSRDDELLDEIPELEVGGFAGYRAGNRPRRWVFAIVAITVVGATVAGIRYARQQEATLRGGAGGSYELDPAADPPGSRPRELLWSSGRARLGLSRAEPGVNAIRLPDQVIRLADGHDHAQVRVEVRDGKTHRVDVLVGEVVIERLDGPGP